MQEPNNFLLLLFSSDQSIRGKEHAFYYLWHTNIKGWEWQSPEAFSGE